MTEVGTDLSVRAALRHAQREIEPLDARVLLCHVTGRSAAQLISHDEVQLTASQQAEFEALVSRRKVGEPVAYLTGTREFFERAFKVTPDVLIPRPETELLVELALERLPAPAAAQVLDLGTGSGCIGLSLVSERTHLKLVASDQSLEALQVAVQNAGRLNLSGVRFVQSHWFDTIDTERFDLIVSNPPYVAELDPHLTQGDLRFEPRAALAGGPDGLACIRVIVSGALNYLAPGGWLLLEHGYDQAQAVRALMNEAGYSAIFSARDLAGIERVSGGRLTIASRSR
ncbi:MAG TPA: peptide chain release factor N(5)-glutamine methyltransferase [Burkholderiales bacterium]|nr:peptide chain release factor N(5)-glutamine methyltransferase [Burkholderiales bacterium]